MRVDRVKIVNQLKEDLEKGASKDKEELAKELFLKYINPLYTYINIQNENGNTEIQHK